MTPQDFLPRHWDLLVRRLQGPMSFRFQVQPLAAVILALRAAYRDARAGRPPYFFWPVFVDAAKRKELIALAWQDIGKVFIVASVLDLLYQWIALRWIYPGHALIVASSLAVVPYLLVRGPITRILRAFVRPNDAN